MEGRGLCKRRQHQPGLLRLVVECRGDKVQRETIYFAEPFPAPDWRKPWTEEGASWERQPDLPARLPDRS
jgi:hypothetical protein